MALIDRPCDVDISIKAGKEGEHIMEVRDKSYISFCEANK